MAANGASTMDVPAVVTAAAKTVAGEAGFRQPRFQVESGSNDGDGYTSVIYRVVVRDEDKDGPSELRLICKTTAADTSAGNMMHFFYEAEDGIYSKVFPVLESMAQLKEPLPWARCYHASLQSARPCLVVADKCPEGFRMANRRVALDEHHLHHALYQLGRFHGAAMAMQVLRTDEFHGIVDNFTEAFKKEDVLQMWRAFMGASENTPDMLLDRFPAGSEVNVKLKRFFSTFVEKFIGEMLTPGKEVGNSLIHGDCHVNNMLFQYDEAGAVTGCCLIDFQTTRFSTTAQDLTTLIMSCTEKAMRDKHWDSLLRHYHTVLQDTLRDAGIPDPDTVYSWEQFMRRLGDVAGYGLYMTPLLLYAMQADLAEVKELQGSVATILAEDGTLPQEAKAGFNVKWTPDVKRRVGDLVEDMVRWGWL